MVARATVHHCEECGKEVNVGVPFTIKYEGDEWDDRYLCSTKCLDDFVVVAEAEAILDEVAFDD